MKKWSLFFALLALPGVVLASSWFWTSDLNITQTPNVTENGAWSSEHLIAVPLRNQNHIYVAYTKRDAGNNLEVFLKRKSGSVWQTEQQLTFSPHCVIHWSELSLATDPTGQYVYVTFVDDKNSPLCQIAIVRSTDYGATWGTPEQITDVSSHHYNQVDVAAADSGLVFVVWYEGYGYSGEIHSIQFAYNIDYGTAANGWYWAPWNGYTGFDVTFPSVDSAYGWPSIAVDPNGAFVHVAWKDFPTTTEHILYRRSNKSSAHSGYKWNWPYAPNAEPIHDLASCVVPSGQQDGVSPPAIACSKDGLNKVHVVWSDWRDGTLYNREVYYKRSTDTGHTWASVNQGLTRLSNLTSETSVGATISTGSGSQGEIVDFVYENWKSYPPPNYNIYKPFWRRSWDAGSTWGTQQNISDIGYGGEPWVATDFTDGANFMYGRVYPEPPDLFYKRYYCNPCDPPKNSSLAGVEDLNPHFDLKPYDKTPMGVQVTPNPTGGEVRISLGLNAKDVGVAEAYIYDVQGRFVRSLPLGSDSRALSAKWDGKDASGRQVGNGVYLVSIPYLGGNEVGRVIVAR